MIFQMEDVFIRLFIRNYMRQKTKDELLRAEKCILELRRWWKPSGGSIRCSSICPSQRWSWCKMWITLSVQSSVLLNLNESGLWFWLLFGHLCTFSHPELGSTPSRSWGEALEVSLGSTQTAFQHIYLDQEKLISKWATGNAIKNRKNFISYSTYFLIIISTWCEAEVKLTVLL